MQYNIRNENFSPCLQTDCDRQCCSSENSLVGIPNNIDVKILCWESLHTSNSLKSVDLGEYITAF